MRYDGGAPDELNDGDLCQRFSWTFTELDEQDMGRVWLSVQSMNVRDALGRVLAFLSTHGAVQPTPSDWQIWQESEKALKDTGLWQTPQPQAEIDPGFDEA